MNGYLITFLKAVVSFIVLLILARLMGRRHLSQITFFDYIVGITIGSVVATIISDRTVNPWDGIISTSVWALMSILISYINLKSITMRKLTDGEPIIVMKNGTIDDRKLKKSGYNIGDLLMQLRQKDVFDLAEVEFALLEPNGHLSVLKKSNYNPVTPKDLNISSEYKGLIIELILNGNILKSHLKIVHKDKAWLMKELKKRKVEKIEDVIYAGVSNDGQLEIVLKNNLSKVYKQ